MFSELKGYARFVSEQPPYNLLDRRIENELIPLCQRHGLGIITWAPMAMGVLAGRYTSADDYPENSRAALRGGFYADRVTRRGIEVGIASSHQDRRAGGTVAGPARDPLEQGSAGCHRAADRTTHDGAPGTAAAGARDEPVGLRCGRRATSWCRPAAASPAFITPPTG